MKTRAIKKKRAKPFSANLASRKLLESQGWSVSVTEQTIPHCFIKRDTFNMADLLICSPSRGIGLVQVTGGATSSNFHARVRKIKSNPMLGIWLASGGRMIVHSWEGKGKNRQCRFLEITKD